MYRERTTSGLIVYYLKDAGGRTTKTSTQIAKELELPLSTVRDAIFRLQKLAVLSHRDEENSLCLLQQGE